MILRYEHGKLVEQRTYREALFIESDVSPVLSIVGAGGKTTTVFHLTQEYRNAGIPVAVTTSTHMQAGEESWFLLEESEEKLRQILKKEKQAWFGLPTPPKEGVEIRKMQAVSDTFFRQVCELQIPVIVEADGARHLPCKAPGEHEPVLYPETTDVIAVYGLDAVGYPIREVCFRPERVAEILGKDMTERLEPEDIAVLALDERGGKKNVSADRKYHVILNKADDAMRLKAARQICELTAAKENINILVTAHRSCCTQGTVRSNDFSGEDLGHEDID